MGRYTVLVSFLVLFVLLKMLVTFTGKIVVVSEFQKWVSFGGTTGFDKEAKNMEKPSKT